MGEWPTEPNAIAAHRAAFDQMRRALAALLKRYVILIESGDCGYWDPEDEEEVTSARAALRAAGYEEGGQ